MTEQSNAELIAEANAVSTNDVVANPRRYRNLIGRLAERLDAADKKSRDLFQENYELGRQRDEYAAVMEGVRELPRYSVPDPVMSWSAVDGEDLDHALASASADALREHDAALIEGLADEALGDELASIWVSTWLREKARQRREEQS